MTAPWREQHSELPPGGACAVPCAELAPRTSASVVASRCGSCAPAPCPLPPSSWQPAPATDTSTCNPCSEENVTLVASPYDTPHGCELVLKKKAGRCWTTPSILPSPGDASSSCQPHRTYTHHVKTEKESGKALAVQLNTRTLVPYTLVQKTPGARSDRHTAA